MDKLINELDALPLDQYLSVVQQTSNVRYEAMRRITAKASLLYELSTICSRYARLLKG